MKRTIQKSLSGDELPVQSRTQVEPIHLNDIIWLPIKYIISTINLQKSLFLSSFLTYGVGDGVTAVYMIEKTSVMRETNPIVKFMYASSGKQGVISLKIWFTLMILFLVWITSRKTNIYWTINGFLSALTLGGAMAMRANMMAAFGMEPPSPGSVIITFLFMVILFVMIGDLMDKLHVK
ncbi:MAG: hypothetical protein WAW23_08145 [Candidatus Methanoperedens sp.]